jgi:hypothetical protein
VPVARLSVPPRSGPSSPAVSSGPKAPLDLPFRGQRLPRRRPPLAPHHDHRPQARLTDAEDPVENDLTAGYFAQQGVIPQNRSMRSEI